MSRLLSALASTAVAAAGLTATVALATPAATAKDAPTGDFAVTVGGKTYNPAAGKDLRLSGLAAQDVTVSGINVGFTVDSATLGVYDYTLTGAPNPERMVAQPTVIFASKVPVLTADQLKGAKISRLEIKDDRLNLIFTTAGGKLKIQAKDAPQGGTFQMEPEMAGPVEVEHTLGEGLFYFENPFTGKINFGDGLDPVSQADSPTGYHQMLLGKDSPQVATKLSQDATTTRWSIAPGGRVGGVLGEDAIELSAGATNCTSHCQAQNRVGGSLPVPPLPTDPTPVDPTPADPTTTEPTPTDPTATATASATATATQEPTEDPTDATPSASATSEPTASSTPSADATPSSAGPDDDDSTPHS